MDNVNIDPHSLEDKAQNILNQYKIIEEAIEDIRNSQSALSSWQSTNKDKYEAKINIAIQKMEDMAKAIGSYGGVAKIASQSIIAAEKSIANRMEA